MTHLDALRAELAAIEALHKGVKRKGNPDYVLDPMTHRYKLKEPKAKKGRRGIPAGWDTERVNAVTASLAELFPEPDSTVAARVKDPAYPHGHRARLQWAFMANLVEPAGDGSRLQLSDAGHAFMQRRRR